MDFNWKEIGKKCDESLDSNTVKTLQELDMTDCSRMNTLTLRSHIMRALPASSNPYSNRRSLALDLAVVAKYGLPTYTSWIICFGDKPFKVKCRLPNKSVMS